MRSQTRRAATPETSTCAPIGVLYRSWPSDSPSCSHDLLSTTRPCLIIASLWSSKWNLRFDEYQTGSSAILLEVDVALLIMASLRSPRWGFCSCEYKTGSTVTLTSYTSGMPLSKAELTGCPCCWGKGLAFVAKTCKSLKSINYSRSASPVWCTNPGQSP